MKLSIILKKKPFCNNVIYFFISVILIILSFKYPFMWIFVGLYSIYITLKSKILLPIIILSLIFVIRILIDKLIIIDDKDNYDVYVNDVIDDKSYIGYIGINKVLIYDNNHEVKPGEKYNMRLSIYEYKKKSYDTDFDYEYYYKSKGIKNVYKVLNKEYLSLGFSINSIKYYYLDYLKDNLSSDTYLYVKALVFGDNELDNDIKDSYSILGLSHILAISGMHIIFLFNVISFILLKLFNYYNKLIPIIIVSLFVIIIGMPISSIRALLFLIIGSLNKGNKRYGKIDILSISGLLMLIVNPYLVYSTGFILSFLVSYVLIIKNDVFKKNDGLIINSIKVYLLIFIITLPFIVNINNKISILSIILSPILSSVIGYLILPIAYVLSILPILDIIFKYVFIFLNMYIVGIGNYLPIIHLMSFNYYMILVYYMIFGVFIYGLYNGGGIYYFCLILSYIFMLNNAKYIDNKGRVTFIDVGQGDSALIEVPYSKGIMVIDCFNDIRYLKSRGINYIDYLVLTHSDNDHISDYKLILDEFRVGSVYYSKYDDRFIELLDGIKNIYPISDINKLNNEYFNVDILGPINRYDDYNNNSIVMKIKIYENSFLFTGDMSISEENDVINKYSDILDSDILKVAHHGSISSSSEEFIKLVSPNVSVISVGKNNNYGLPNDLILDRLNKYSKVYMTKDCGNIDIMVNKNRFWVNTFK